LVPLKGSDNSYDGNVNVDTMYNNVMTKFKFGGADKPNVYFDENGRRTLLTIRRAFFTLGLALVAEGKKDSALKVLNYGDKMINHTTLPYAMVSGQGSLHNIVGMQYAYAYYMAGDSKKGDEIGDEIIKDCQQQLAYYDSVSSDVQFIYQQEQQTAGGIMKQLLDWKKQFNTPTPVTK
jgi:hypothetical protein